MEASLSGTKGLGGTGIHSSAPSAPTGVLWLVTSFFPSRAWLSDAGSERADGRLNLGLGLAKWAEQEDNVRSRLFGGRTLGEMLCGILYVLWLDFRDLKCYF